MLLRLSISVAETTTSLGRSCSFGLLCGSFVNVCVCASLLFRVEGRR